MSQAGRSADRFSYEKDRKDGKIFDKNDYKLRYERFPFPSYTDDPFLRSFSDNLPLVLFLAFVYFGAQVSV